MICWGEAEELLVCGVPPIVFLKPKLNLPLKSIIGDVSYAINSMEHHHEEHRGRPGIQGKLRLKSPGLKSI